jgi:hypothetical protein
MIQAGLDVIAPSIKFGSDHIGFFAANDDTQARLVEYDEFMASEPMAIIINCSQLYGDMMKLYKARGEVDRLVFLTSQMGFGEWLPEDSDFLMTHELAWHRKSTAKHKILLFNRPKLLVPTKTPQEIRQAFLDRHIKLYVNHFTTKIFDNTTFSRELAAAEEFRAKWKERTGYTIPFYGYENPDGYLTMQEVHENIKDSMFTLVFKGHETWGQMVNESMLIGTPCIFLEQFIVDMFTQYLITPETAVIDKTVDGLLKQLDSMRYEDYETLVMESRSQSQMFTEPSNRIAKLQWLFSKVEESFSI